MLPTKEAAFELQVIGFVGRPLKLRVKVPLVIVPAKAMRCTAAVVGRAPVVVVVTVMVAPGRLVASAVMVACGPGNWKVTVTVLKPTEATFGLPCCSTTWAPGSVVPPMVALLLASGPV